MRTRAKGIPTHARTASWKLAKQGEKVATLAIRVCQMFEDLVADV